MPQEAEAAEVRCPNSASSIRTLGVFLTLFSASAVIGERATASTLLESVLQGNDCSFPTGGAFFTGSGCNVTNGQPDLVHGGLQRFSPLVFQLNSDGFKLFGFLTIDGTEFSVGPFIDTGFFTYTPGNGDPAVRFWATEGITQFLLSWFGRMQMRDSWLDVRQRGVSVFQLFRHKVAPCVSERRVSPWFDKKGDARRSEVKSLGPIVGVTFVGVPNRARRGLSPFTAKPYIHTAILWDKGHVRTSLL